MFHFCYTRITSLCDLLYVIIVYALHTMRLYVDLDRNLLYIFPAEYVRMRQHESKWTPATIVVY